MIALRHAGSVGAAFAAAPAPALAAAAALHLATLVLRSEAWRVTLSAAGAGSLARSAVHRANAWAFVAGTLQSQAALAARVAMLRRLAGPRAPRAATVWLADAPIFALELCATALLVCAGVLAGGGAAWVALLAAGLAAAVLTALLVASNCSTRRPRLLGLAVLADHARRDKLVALVAAISILTAARVWVVLSACEVPHGLGQVAAVVAALGVFGLLPIGAGAPPSATLAALGGAATGSAIASGLILGASSIVAVAGYALLVGVLSFAARRVRPGRRAPRGDPHPVADASGRALAAGHAR